MSPASARHCLHTNVMAHLLWACGYMGECDGLIVAELERLVIACGSYVGRGICHRARGCEAEDEYTELGGSLEWVAVWLAPLADSVIVMVMLSIDIMCIFWHEISPFKFIMQITYCNYTKTRSSG